MRSGGCDWSADMGWQQVKWKPGIRVSHITQKQVLRFLVYFLVLTYPQIWLADEYCILSWWEGWLLRYARHFLYEDLCFLWKEGLAGTSPANLSFGMTPCTLLSVGASQVAKSSFLYDSDKDLFAWHRSGWLLGHFPAWNWWYSQFFLTASKKVVNLYQIVLVILNIQVSLLKMKPMRLLLAIHVGSVLGFSLGKLWCLVIIIIFRFLW